jgi:spermidine synthase
MTTERWFLAAYACSGLAGLVYEITWTRLLTLHLGHTTAAVSTVTAAFMGGLGIGGALGGRIASRMSRRRALWTYVLLELVVALAAFSIAGSLRLLTPVFAWAYGEDGADSVFSIVRVACSFAVLLVPGVALGATFPMAVRVLVTSPTRTGGSAGRLYGANTAGAAVGSLAAGFFLIPTLGLTGTTLTGMAASAGSIALALLIARRDFTDVVSEDTPARPRLKRRDARHTRPKQRSGRVAANGDGVDGWNTERQRYGLAAAVLALTGFATFVHEVVWTRVLAMVVGPSIYAFAATLTSFITGLALGSFVGASLAERSRRPAVALALTLTATAGAACVSIALVGSSLLEIGPGASRHTASLVGIALPHLAIAFGLTLPIAFGLGVAFPLSLELAGSRDAIPAQRLGVLYAVNTAASVAGALVAGFVFIPAIGLRTSLLVATTSLMLGATVLVVRGRSSSLSRRSGAKADGRLVALLPLAAVVAWMATSAGWDREWLAAGGYLYTRFVPPGVDRRAALTAGSLLYYREGATGTVSVKALTGDRSLSIDGKVDASTARDMLTQKMLAHLPLLLHPNPRQVGIVGLGSGVTLASALVHPVRSVDVVEISPEVVEASAHFAEVNRQSLDDARTRLVRGDGRTHLSLTSRRYDVVISEPSNPWMAGVAALFTEEFFRTVRGRLEPGGVFCQWAHTYDVSDADLRSIVATFRAVFPDGTMWLAGDGDLLLVGSTVPLEPRLEEIATAWQRPGVREDLRTMGMNEPFALLSLFVGGPGEMSRYGAGAAVQTDERTALEFSGPFAVFGGVPANHAETLRALLDEGRRPPAVARALTGATASQWRDRGAMLMDAEAVGSAYRDYARALDLAPTDKATLDGFVRAAAAARQEDDAERRLRALIQSRAGEPAPRISLAELLGMRGRFDEATTVATEATRLAPGDPAAWEQLASLHADRGDVARLGPAVEVLRREFPNRAATWYFAASESFLRGDLAAALPLVRRAIELNASYADAHNLLGAIHATAGDIDTGRGEFRTSLRLDPRDAVTYVNLAQLELAAGQRSVAAGLFAEALSLDPSSAPAREGLAQAKDAR